MKVDRHLKSYGNVRVHAHDYVLDDDDAERIWVRLFADSNRLFAKVAHSALSVQFVFFVPCHAYQHFVWIPQKSVNELNFSILHVAL